MRRQDRKKVRSVPTPRIGKQPTLEDVRRFLRQPKPPERHVPTLNDGHLPPIGAKQVFDYVTKGIGWKTLAQEAAEDAAARRAKKLADLYDRVEIPEPIFDPEDRDL
jgi:hypothetical protein